MRAEWGRDMPGKIDLSLNGMNKEIEGRAHIRRLRNLANRDSGQARPFLIHSS